MSVTRPAVAFDDVRVVYPGGARPALDAVSLDVPNGRLTAVVGPNGSGKSTLVRALLGRVPVAAGRVLVDGDDARTLGRREVARRVAVVTQREELAFPLGVRDYVRLGRLPHLSPWGGPGPRDEEAVQRALHVAGVEDLVDRATDALSGGEWQRVRIARALAQGARALVLDEPTTFLDIAHEMAVFELADELARSGHAVLLVSHQLNLVARFAEWVVLLHRGRVAASGAPTVVMHGPTLEQVYEWPLVVTRDPAVGAPALFPLRGPRA
jgi:iron complex transport system ATP-binding protein